MIYITGDTHGDFRNVERFCKKMQTSKDDVLIILGDAGINYYGPEQDERKKSIWNRCPLRFLRSMAIMKCGRRRSRPTMKQTGMVAKFTWKTTIRISCLPRMRNCIN